MGYLIWLSILSAGGIAIGLACAAFEATQMTALLFGVVWGFAVTQWCFAKGIL